MSTEWLRAERVTCSFGAHVVLDGISATLRGADKIGLVGANGAGKTTLLRILAGEQAPDGGSVVRARGARIGYVAQSMTVDDRATLASIMRSAFAKLQEEEDALRGMETEIAVAAERGDVAAERKLLDRYAAAREAFERHGGFGFEHRMRSLLSVFGLGERELQTPAGALSGGQRTRAAIARALLEEPDCLLLDEPTNHLDADAVRYLEQLLCRDARPAIVVSHDRYFLDRVCTGIWQLERASLVAYAPRRGEPPYTAYVAARAQRDEEAKRAYERTLAEKKRREAVIAELRTHGSHNYAQVRSREKMLARSADPQAVRTVARPIGVRLAAQRDASRGLCFAVRGLRKSFDAVLFDGLDLQVARGERIAVVGPNGAGKSTLLKIIAGRMPADDGEVLFANGVKAVYFAQESADDLPAGSRAVDAVANAPGVRPQQARALLGRMGLGGDAADKLVESFSGGERRRIMLARLMTRETDCLLLDEPTNDLDIASREALEAALDAFSGSMLIVSHDRYLLRRLADRVLELRDGTWTLIDGQYDAYEARVRPGAAEPATDAARDARERPQAAAAARGDEVVDVDRPLVVLSKNKRAELEKRLAEKEREIERLERRYADLEREYGDPELYTDPRRVKDVHQELERVRAAMADATVQWEHCVETLNAATS